MIENKRGCEPHQRNMSFKFRGGLMVTVVGLLFVPTHSLFSMTETSKEVGNSNTFFRCDKYGENSLCFLPGGSTLWSQIRPPAMASFGVNRCESIRAQPASRKVEHRRRCPLSICNLRMDGWDEGQGVAPPKLGKKTGKGFTVPPGVKGKRSRAKDSVLDGLEGIEIETADMDLLKPEVNIAPIPVYNWSLLGLDVSSTPSINETASMTTSPSTTTQESMPSEESSAPTPFSDSRSSSPLEPSSEGEANNIQEQLKKEILTLQEEHRDINEVTDRLVALGRAGSPQLSALKKRKLMLKDRIAELEKIATDLQERQQMMFAEEELSEDDDEEDDPEELALSEMMEHLKERGLRPDSVPPHKDSYFLALMKSLQRAGLRPRGYDFREAEVLGSAQQFPFAAKRAKHEVLGLLASQVHKLGGRIGGWQLSPQEFRRYFSKAWWNVPAARHDLFMASAHLFSVRITCLSISPEGLERQVYDPPGGNPRATLHLCRRADHVISTLPRDTSASNALAFAPPQPWEVQAMEDEVALASLPPPLVQPAGAEEEEQEDRIDMEDAEEEDGLDAGLDAGLGLLDEVEDGELSDEEDYVGLDDREVDRSELEDDEVVDDPRYRQRIGAMYERQVATKRLFLAVKLEDEAKATVAALVDSIRRSFPLDSKVLDRALRWVEPDSLHITLHSMEVAADALYDVEDAMYSAVQETGLKPFTLKTGSLGCFWRSAGSGWGRLPRVVWLGMEEGGLGPLLTLHDAVGQRCVAEGFDSSRQPFCAHITVGKTRNADGVGREERRTLRAFGKWIQDSERPMALQRALEERVEKKGGREGLVEAAGGGGRRGTKRFKAWVSKKGGSVVAAGAGAGGEGPGASGKVGKVKKLKVGHRKEKRDLGAMNAEVAEQWVESSGEAMVEVGMGEVEVNVRTVTLVEAVTKPGTNLITYKTVAEIPLGEEEDGLVEEEEEEEL